MFFINQLALESQSILTMTDKQSSAPENVTQSSYLSKDDELYSDIDFDTLPDSIPSPTYNYDDTLSLNNGPWHDVDEVMKIAKQQAALILKKSLSESKEMIDIAVVQSEKYIKDFCSCGRDEAMVAIKTLAKYPTLEDLSKDQFVYYIPSLHRRLNTGYGGNFSNKHYHEWETVFYDTQFSMKETAKEQAKDILRIAYERVQLITDEVKKQAIKISSSKCRHGDY